MAVGERIAALTLLQTGSYIRTHGDVAELADAQVSEACDGDIVEVQVLSSPPKVWASSPEFALFDGSISSVPA
jgi:hypothetical protein